MAYTPTVWKNGEFPPIDAEHLNKIEQGIANSAPGGFGLGGVVAVAPKNSEGWPDANLITATGFYRAIAHTILGGWDYIIHLEYDSTTALQFGGYAAGEQYGVREKHQGIWIDWEFINPEMAITREYRTTDRYLGKPVFKYLLNGFEAWRPDGQNDWASAGKAVLFSTEKGGTKNISLETGRTYIFSATNNVFGGVVIVQTMDATVRAITPLVPLANWKIEAGSGLSVNVTDTDGRYGVTVSAMML